jgi:hypothetical protein
MKLLPRNTRSALLPLAAASALLFSGCATAPKQTWTRTGDPVLDGKMAMAQGPEKDRALWGYRTGLTALRKGNYADAQSCLDEALLTLGGVYGQDKNAKKARGYFHGEEKKTFIGEPYERVMAYFYRGILYWMNGEPDNARACFRSAQLQDADSENKEYQNDWVLLDYLDGYASVKLSGDGQDAYLRADKNFKLGKLPDYNKNANTLVFLEFGEGPTKYATGEFNEELRIREGRSIVRGAWVKVGNKAIRIAPYDDVNYQAKTRGGRVMDHILANKAVFKSSTDTFGNVGIIGGAILASNRGTQEAGLGLLAAGVLSKVVSAATTPRADTRAWDNLPGYLSFVALELPPGPHEAVVEFVDAAGNVLPSYTKTLTFNVSSEGTDTVLFVSDRKS